MNNPKVMKDYSQTSDNLRQTHFFWITTSGAQGSLLLGTMSGAGDQYCVRHLNPCHLSSPSPSPSKIAQEIKRLKMYFNKVMLLYCSISQKNSKDYQGQIKHGTLIKNEQRNYLRQASWRATVWPFAYSNPISEIVLGLSRKAVTSNIIDKIGDPWAFPYPRK